MPSTSTRQPPAMVGRSVALATPAGGKQDLAYGLSKESAAQLIAFVEQQRDAEAAALRAAEQRQSLV